MPRQPTAASPAVESSATANPAGDVVSVSSLAGRLSRASAHLDAASAGLSHDDLGEKIRNNIARINYPLTPENIAARSTEVPQPADPKASASAAAANAYVADLSLPNPFAGRSRDQLSLIVNDESGTFTSNEKYAAYRQAYEEEQAWRTKAVNAAMEEYHKSGKLTNFFSSLLDHFNELPLSEQSLYPANYAADLQGKIDLDFNYFTHMPNGLPGKAEISLANLRSMAALDDQSGELRA